MSNPRHKTASAPHPKNTKHKTTKGGTNRYSKSSSEYLLHQHFTKMKNGGGGLPGWVMNFFEKWFDCCAFCFGDGTGTGLFAGWCWRWFWLMMEMRFSCCCCHDQGATRDVFEFNLDVEWLWLFLLRDVIKGVTKILIFRGCVSWRVRSLWDYIIRKY